MKKLLASLVLGWSLFSTGALVHAQQAPAAPVAASAEGQPADAAASAKSLAAAVDAVLCSKTTAVCAPGVASNS